MRSDYMIGHIQDALAADPRVNKQDVTVAIRGNRVHLMGQTSTEDRRRAIVAVVAELVPGMEVVDELVVLEVEAPGQAEVIER